MDCRKAHSVKAMKKIKLSRGKFAILDNKDFRNLSRFTWCINGGGYAFRTDHNGGSPVGIYMHRCILIAEKGIQIDHKNGNKLDNRRSNLRRCNTSENSLNKKMGIRNKSGFKGVSKTTSGWRAAIVRNGRQYHLGVFQSKLRAALAYDSAARQIHGRFCRTNKTLGLL